MLSRQNRKCSCQTSELFDAGEPSPSQHHLQNAQVGRCRMTSFNVATHKGEQDANLNAVCYIWKDMKILHPFPQP